MGIWAADPCPTESGTPMTGVQICESFSLLFTLVPIPNPTMRQLRQEVVAAGVALWKQRSQEAPISFYPTLALALSPPL